MHFGRALPIVLVAAALSAGTADAAVYLTKDEALALAFGDAEVERLSFLLDDARTNAVQKRASARLTSRVVAAYVATRGDSLIGCAFFDTRTVRTMPGVFMTVVAPDTTVSAVHVLAFHEPPDYEPPAKWLDQFDGRPLADGMRPKRDIRNLSGATLTARSVSESVRLALAMFELLVAPRRETAATD